MGAPEPGREHRPAHELGPWPKDACCQDQDADDRKRQRNEQLLAGRPLDAEPGGNQQPDHVQRYGNSLQDNQALSLLERSLASGKGLADRVGSRYVRATDDTTGVV